MTNNQYLDYILELLSPYGEITSRAMFGGHGIYKNKIIFAIIADNELYFKVDETNKKQYIVMNSEPFTYEKKGLGVLLNKGKSKKINMSYWKLPLEILEDSTKLAIWIEQSYCLSLKNKK